MDEFENTQNEKSFSFISALGLLGLGVGIIALILGIFAMIKLGDSTKIMDGKIDKANALELEIKKINDRLDAMPLQINNVRDENTAKIDSLTKQIQGTNNAIVNQINTLRNEIVTNREAIKILATRTTRKEAPQAKSTEEVKTATAQETPEQTAQSSDTENSQKTHTIQSGDTFARLAKKYNVTIEAIQKANPTANSRNLKIGQKIVIP